MEKINEWQKQLNAVMKHFSLTIEVLTYDETEIFKVLKYANWPIDDVIHSTKF